MSDTNDLRRQKLEQATAVEPAAALDAETRGLRETWLSLGQLLEAAGADDGPHLVFPATVLRRKRSRWPLALAGLMAASLLVAAAVAWMKWTVRQPHTDLASAKQPAATSGAVATSKSAGRNGEKRVAVASDSTWDDALDSQITEIGQQLIQTEQQWSSQPDAFEVAQYTVEWAQYDLDDSRL
jgi:hypothetical protein